jgi:hypothetical protein
MMLEARSARATDASRRQLALRLDAACRLPPCLPLRLSGRRVYPAGFLSRAWSGGRYRKLAR